DKHDYDEGTITKEATAFEEGVKTYLCRRCGHEKTEVIDRIELDEDMAEDLSEVMEDMDTETDKVEVSKKDNADGSSETVISVGDEEVSRTETDADGNIVEESKIWIAGLKSSYIYCGEAIKPEIHVYDGLRRLTEGSDYSVAFKNNKKSGKDAKLILSFKGSYKLTEKKEFAFEIKPAELGKDVIAKDGSVNVGGKPAANVLFAENGRKVPAKDLEITYSGDTAAAGTITVNIKPASSDYSGSTQAVITVTDNKVLMLENAKVKTEQKKYTYTGEPVSANVIVVLDGKELKKGIDYTVSQISNNVEPGTATMVLEAIKGNPEGYIGSKAVTYKIVKGRMLEKGNGFRIEMSEKQTYEKGGVKPVLKVYDGDTLLKEGVDYKLSIKGNKKAGRTGSVTVRGKGKYKGSVKLNFAVEASDISKLTVVSADAVMSPKNADPGAVIIDTNKKQLKEGVDYRIVQDPTSPVGGKYMDVIAKGIGNYNGEVRIWYRDIETSKNVGKIKNVKIPAVPYAPGGTTIDKKTLEGLFGGELVYGRDYVAAGYINNTKPGTAKLVVKGIGNYGGVRLISFKISAKKGVIKGAYRDGGWK
ncbi:MAG: hypothetical protein K5686_04120, partial [Lachnospiraceae bacterium]|nr:hypothetical protein [Lachnospiraceae bacterium]